MPGTRALPTARHRLPGGSTQSSSSGSTGRARTFSAATSRCCDDHARSLQRLVRERPTPASRRTLTVQERRVLQLVADRAVQRGDRGAPLVAVSTVRKHLEHAYRKLGVTNRMAAVGPLRGAVRPVDHEAGPRAR